MSQERNGFKKLTVFNASYQLAIEIHHLSKTFPAVEKYLLVNQVRRSSRSVCANIAEAYGKRRYLKHFISKLTDADGEASETILWLDFAKEFSYINSDQHKKLVTRYYEVGRMIGGMIKHPDKFQPRT
jgi:four helix bundle protein